MFLRCVRWIFLSVGLSLLCSLVHAQQPPEFWCNEYSCPRTWSSPEVGAEVLTNEWMAYLASANPSNRYFRTFAARCNPIYSDIVHCTAGLSYENSLGYTVVNDFVDRFTAKCPLVNGVRPSVSGGMYPNVICPGSPPTISIVGPGQTRTQPVGPSVGLSAIVSGSNRVGVAISITVNGQGAISGVTDSNGEFGFTYTPGASPGVATLAGSCTGCSNTAQKTLQIVGVESDTCKANPIAMGTGEKLQREFDWEDAGAHPLTLVRNYRSFAPAIAPSSALGSHWSHNFDAASQGAGNEWLIRYGDGSVTSFRRADVSSPWVSDDGVETLVTDAAGITVRRADDSVWLFEPSTSGKLLSISLKNGWKYSLFYQSGLLDRVVNHFGRQLKFYYDAGRLIRVENPGGRTDYQYDAQGRLLSTTTTDFGTGSTVSGRAYLYEKAGFPNALTSILDENNVRFAEFLYDNSGRAIQSGHIGGVQLYGMSFASTTAAGGYVSAGRLAPGATDPAQVSISLSVLGPLGSNKGYVFGKGFGNKAALYGVTGGSGDGDGFASKSFGTSSLPLAETDFLGTTTSYAWNTDRRLPTAVTEAAGKPEERTTVTEWHPQWRLPVAISESGRTTSYTYDSVGNRLTQTITDTGAGMGSGIARTTTWTYHPSGLVATETAPNGAVTSYQYDSAGNLTSSTNALGHVDTYTHDAAGRILTHTAPTGLVTTYTYDPRGRMLTANRGGQLTTLTYRPSGQVATATMPYGHVITYTYDTAQRLTGWSDNRGHSGTYTLDAMGNRTREEVRNAQGQLAWLLVRNINSLNRVQSTTVGGQLTTSYGFDANGETVSSTNGANESTQLGLDGLRRVKTITNAANATASLSYNALDGVIQASDFKGVGTTYARDALGNATGESSPDSGLQSTQYDALGLPSTVTDALGQATSIERDLLGRPTLITQVGGPTTTLRYDLSGPAYNQAGQPNASKGSLSEIVDASGTTTYQRDNFGRVTAKTQTLLSGTARSVGYAYASNGLLASTTYPAGQVLQHVYDATGQITGLNWAGQALVTGITWNPLGQPTGWSWNLPGSSSAIPATRSYNTAGQLTATEFSSYLYNSAGRIYNLTQNLWKPGSTDPLETTLAQADNTWNVQYDSLGRITQMGDGVRIVTYQYDANGNRTSSVRTTVTGTPPVTNTLSRTYGTAAGHNRLLGFEQTAATTGIGGSAGSSSTANVTYQYNAAGDLLGDGLTSYAYDSQGRMESATTGASPEAPKTKYAYNALGQRVFKTEPLYSAAGKPASSKNLNNLLADEDDKETAQEQPGLIQQLVNFFSKLWSPSTSDAEKLGWTYVYAEDGSLLAEYGEGGAATSGSAQYLWLPTANGPMPIAAVIKGQTYAVHSDHLNTPRKLTQADGQVVWQWAYSAFGDEQPTTAAKRFTSEMTTPSTGSTSIADVTFNLRYPGQYFDKETNLHYNYFRTYAPDMGRYTQGDPIGLDGGFNRFGYVVSDPLSMTDPMGLMGSGGNRSPRSNDHKYEWTTFRCMGDCREQTMRELRCNPAPGVTPASPTETGAVNTVRLVGMPLGDITTAVSSTSNTTWNLTMPGHLLHPGWVRRDVVYDGKATWVVNTGGGTGFNPLNLNTILAPIVWGGTNPSRLPTGEGCSCGK